jgi:hypothetical protein
MVDFRKLSEHLAAARAENERRRAAGLPSIEQEEIQRQKDAEEARRAAIPTFTVRGTVAEWSGSRYTSEGVPNGTLYLTLDDNTPADIRQRLQPESNAYTRAQCWESLAERLDRDWPEPGTRVEVTGYWKRFTSGGEFRWHMTARQIEILV